MISVFRNIFLLLSKINVGGSWWNIKYIYIVVPISKWNETFYLMNWKARVLRYIRIRYRLRVVFSVVGMTCIIDWTRLNKKYALDYLMKIRWASSPKITFSHYYTLVHDITFNVLIAIKVISKSHKLKRRSFLIASFIYQLGNLDSLLREPLFLIFSYNALGLIL